MSIFPNKPIDLFSFCGVFFIFATIFHYVFPFQNFKGSFWAHQTDKNTDSWRGIGFFVGGRWSDQKTWRSSMETRNWRSWEKVRKISFDFKISIIMFYIVIPGKKPPFCGILFTSIIIVQLMVLPKKVLKYHPRWKEALNFSNSCLRSFLFSDNLLDKHSSSFSLPLNSSIRLSKSTSSFIEIVYFYTLQVFMRR